MKPFIDKVDPVVVRREERERILGIIDRYKEIIHRTWDITDNDKDFAIAVVEELRRKVLNE